MEVGELQGLSKPVTRPLSVQVVGLVWKSGVLGIFWDVVMISLQCFFGMVNLFCVCLLLVGCKQSCTKGFGVT